MSWDELFDAVRERTPHILFAAILLLVLATTAADMVVKSLDLAGDTKPPASGQDETLKDCRRISAGTVVCDEPPPVNPSPFQSRR